MSVKCCLILSFFILFSLFCYVLKWWMNFIYKLKKFRIKLMILAVFFLYSFLHKKILYGFRSFRTCLLQNITFTFAWWFLLFFRIFSIYLPNKIIENLKENYKMNRIIIMIETYFININFGFSWWFQKCTITKRTC